MIEQVWLLFKTPSSVKLSKLNEKFRDFLLFSSSNMLFFIFSRVGYIVGNAGTIYSIALLCVAYFILCVTILSICAIATNGAVQVSLARHESSLALRNLNFA